MPGSFIYTFTKRADSKRLMNEKLILSDNNEKSNIIFAVPRNI